MGEPTGLIGSAIDARAAGLAAADLIFVFGTRLTEPAVIAADLYRRSLAPFVVLTGGSDRQPDRLNEPNITKACCWPPAYRPTP